MKKVASPPGENTCACGWQLPHAEINVEVSDAPPKRVIVILTCPSCGMQHTHDWKIDELVQIQGGVSH